MLNRIMKDESGVLTFEWILLITLLVIGIVGGIAVIRDAYIIEAAETAGAMMALSQDYTIAMPLQSVITDTGAGVPSADGSPDGSKVDYYENKDGTIVNKDSDDWEEYQGYDKGHLEWAGITVHYVSAGAMNYKASTGYDSDYIDAAGTTQISVK